MAKAKVKEVEQEVTVPEFPEIEFTEGDYTILWSLVTSDKINVPINIAPAVTALQKKLEAVKAYYESLVQAPQA
ncbi:MAG: hypothetical protein HN932_12965 [Candidatus Marinimicrobia bacterium]|jgi:hypothetical protein|nr:hypothetical protein [Candidatus Neomarinimicrobiota bacterium]MBT7339064.1 hypothetical protein [Candidatus Jacksonbacteria bacterium]